MPTRWLRHLSVIAEVVVKRQVSGGPLLAIPVEKRSVGYRPNCCQFEPAPHIGGSARCAPFVDDGAAKTKRSDQLFASPNRLVGNAVEAAGCMSSHRLIVATPSPGNSLDSCRQSDL